MLTAKHLQFIFVCISSILFSRYCGAEEKLKLMDTVNQAPSCYVLAEIINVYAKEDGDILIKIYINYSNAAHAVLQENDKVNTIPLMFNTATANKRKIFLDSIISSGYQSKMYSDLYDKMMCGRFNKVIKMEEY